MREKIIMKTKVDKSVLVAAIYGLVALELAALYLGLDGKFFMPVVAVVAGLAGLSLPQLKFK